MQRGEQKEVTMKIGFRCPRCEKSFYIEEKDICRDKKGNCCPLCNKRDEKVIR